MEKLRMFVAQEPVVAASCLIAGFGTLSLSLSLAKTLFDLVSNGWDLNAKIEALIQIFINWVFVSCAKLTEFGAFVLRLDICQSLFFL